MTTAPETPTPTPPVLDTEDLRVTLTLPDTRLALTLPATRLEVRT